MGSEQTVDKESGYDEARKIMWDLRCIIRDYLQGVVDRRGYDILDAAHPDSGLETRMHRAVDDACAEARRERQPSVLTEIIKYHAEQAKYCHLQSDSYKNHQRWAAALRALRDGCEEPIEEPTEQQERTWS